MVNQTTLDAPMTDTYFEGKFRALNQKDEVCCPAWTAPAAASRGAVVAGAAGKAVSCSEGGASLVRRALLGGDSIGISYE